MPLNLSAECHLFITPYFKIGSTWIPPNLVNTKWICGFCPYSTDNDTVRHRSSNLNYYVEKDPEDTHLAAGQETQEDGRIQEDAANVVMEAVLLPSYYFVLFSCRTSLQNVYV